MPNSGPVKMWAKTASKALSVNGVMYVRVEVKGWVFLKLCVFYKINETEIEPTNPPEIEKTIIILSTSLIA
jgi:hypothetical protein